MFQKIASNWPIVVNLAYKIPTHVLVKILFARLILGKLFFILKCQFDLMLNVKEKVKARYFL